MNLAEFAEQCEAENRPLTIDAADIDGPDRTLAYGYTCERLSWHVYLKDGEIHRLVTHGSGGLVESHYSRTAWDPRELVPDKRVYPESVDAQFARLLLARGVTLPYTTFDEERYAKVAGLDFHAATR